MDPVGEGVYDEINDDLFGEELPEEESSEVCTDPCGCDGGVGAVVLKGSLAPMLGISFSGSLWRDC